MFIENAYASNDTISIQEDKSTNQPAESSTFSTLSSMIPMVLIFAVFYFFLIRPQEKRRREKETLISTVKKGEEVITNSGIYGIVSKITEADNTVELEIAENVKIKVLKSAIIDIASRTKKEETKKAKK
ncbi:MAG: preprotein translocase subunit YajC [Rickettsia endosymbiont of Bryobia graminum]|nr:preprotein translocase subunit YajC [Rickettsia endosymbiont of Bryobia graminum]